MKLSSCPRCERHVLVEAASCPFCGTQLGTTLALGSALGRAMMIAVVGLSMSCGGDDSTAETTVANTEGLTSQGPTSTSSPVETDAGGADYAGPDTSFTSGPPPGDTSEESSSDETSTGTGTGTGTGTDTDTGDTSSSGGTDSGGVDYAGAGPR